MYTDGDTFVYTPIRENWTVSRLAERMTGRRSERRPERKVEREPEGMLGGKPEGAEPNGAGRLDRLTRLEESVQRLEQTVAHLSELVERLGPSPEFAIETPLAAQPAVEQHSDIKVSVYAGDSATAVLGQIRVSQQE